MSELASQSFGIVGTIDPRSQTAGTLTSDIVDASLYDSVVFIFQSGVVSSCSGKLVMTIYEGTATATVTTSIGAVTWTATNSSDNNFQWIFEIDTQRLTGPTYRYLKGRMVYSAGTGAGMSCVVLGFKPRYHPASVGDLATVQSINVLT